MGAHDPADRLMENQTQEMNSNERMSFSQYSLSIRAMMRIREKYKSLRKQRLETAAAASAQSIMSLCSSSPKVFTFDNLQNPISSRLPSARKRRRKKNMRVLYPNSSLRAAPKKERSQAKNCLYLLCIIVSLQIYNAFENLDDHVLKYDLEGLEKTLKREVFGQKEATEQLLDHLYDYLSTYIHNKPLVLSFHGPTGVGKSHIGRLLTQHFRSVVGDQLVMQYFVPHHCPYDDEIPHCTQTLNARISAMVTQAEEEEKIPLFIFDEVEHMSRKLLDALHDLIHLQNNNEYLNAIYVLISNLGHDDITKFVLQNSNVSVSGHLSLSRKLTPSLRNRLQSYHPLFLGIELIPFTLLEKGHVMECFLDEMSREGFYPDHAHVERLADELSYYTLGKLELSHSGCRQVVAKVNLL